MLLIEAYQKLTQEIIRWLAKMVVRKQNRKMGTTNKNRLQFRARATSHSKFSHA